MHTNLSNLHVRDGTHYINTSSQPRKQQVTHLSYNLENRAEWKPVVLCFSVFLLCNLKTLLIDSKIPLKQAMQEI